MATFRRKTSLRMTPVALFLGAFVLVGAGATVQANSPSRQENTASETTDPAPEHNDPQIDTELLAGGALTAAGLGLGGPAVVYTNAAGGFLRPRRQDAPRQGIR